MESLDVVLTLQEMVSVFPNLEQCWLWVYHTYPLLYILRYTPSSPSFCKAFFHKVMFDFASFSSSFEMSLWFFLFFPLSAVYLLICICWTMHSWNDLTSYWCMFTLMYFWIQFAGINWQFFYVHQENWSIILFFSHIYTQFWHEINTGFKERRW
jgi:hypothetical protein